MVEKYLTKDFVLAYKGSPAHKKDAKEEMFIIFHVLFFFIICPAK
ncbi:MAG: hypothetical protein WCG25_07215 [bacterium]